MSGMKRIAAEVRQFCIDKYGVPQPEEIECGKIRWFNMPYFAMPAAPTDMKSIPYLVIEDIAKEANKIREMLDEHDEKYPTLNGKKVYLHYSMDDPDPRGKIFYEKHPELIEFIGPVEEWRKIHRHLSEKLSVLRDTKALSSEQLELLGIKVDPYLKGKK